MVEPDRIGVHQTHCCIIHGCKYGNKDCPVVLGEIDQTYLCEDCSWSSKSELEIKAWDKVKQVKRKLQLNKLI
jgi:hypothetical protein